MIFQKRDQLYLSTYQKYQYFSNFLVSYIYRYNEEVPMSDDFKIFGDKSFSDLSKDIYNNSKLKRTQLDLLIQEAHSYINTVEDVVIVMPVIKELMDVAVKNDEHLVKLAGVVQRIMSKSAGAQDEFTLLSDEEKDELLNNLQEVAQEVQTVTDTKSLEKKIQHIKDIPNG